ncbi:MAG: HAMP domain-containing sensor histidine kinase [Planctomycetaceae bacterium]
MLFGKSIRGKMIVGAAVLLFLTGGMFASSLNGLLAYRRTVNDLDYSIRESPRSADLIAAMSSLTRPLSLPVASSGPERTRDALVQAQEFRRSLEDARTQVEVFQQRLVRLPFSDNRESMLNTAYRPLLSEVNRELSLLASEGACLTRTEGREAHIQTIFDSVAHIIDVVQSIPDPSSEMFARLRVSQREYLWHLRIVTTTGVAGFVLFGWLVWGGYWWLFVPLSRLHQGALRVAEDGDFDYRINSGTNDEIADLAEAFNSMTARFQSIRANLDDEVRQQTRQIVQSARLAGVGFLAAGVAHEINNPLSAIVGAAGSLEWRLDGLLGQMPENDAQIVRDYLQMMQSESQRCQEITEQLLNFARGNASERSLYDVTAIVGEVIRMAHLIGKFQDREVTVGRTSPCYVWANGPEIKQVILNLVTNALAATESGGRVEISIRDVGTQAEIAVKDNGCGMSSEVMQHIFEPFFTTREAGEGTGLGLSISHRIVQDHGGALEAHSDGPGTGSTFRIWLPADRETAEAKRTAA